MNASPRGSFWWAGLLCLVLLCSTASPVVAAGTPPRAGVVVLAEESWYSPARLWSNFSSTLHTQTAMVQFGIVGMGVALFVILFNNFKK
jgi:hypothetical protein